MHTRYLLTLSAAFLAFLGICFTFLPDELLSHVGVAPIGVIVPLMQLLGALYLGAAILNWMNRGALLGGIYGRPVCLANFFSFAVGALALLKSFVSARFGLDALVVTAAYLAFAIWFGIVLFTHPSATASA